MLTLLDESGDPGLTPESSPLFAVTVVHFPNSEEATACQADLVSLRSELGLSPYKEFHFAKDNRRIIESALRVIARREFIYSTFAIRKQLITDPELRHKHAIYHFACRSALYPLRQQLRQTVLLIDECGGTTFAQDVSNHLRSATREWADDQAVQCIKKTRAVSSKSNPLIQVADYVSGSVYRSLSDRSDRHVYRELIRHRELTVEVWPSA